MTIREELLALEASTAVIDGDTIRTPEGSARVVGLDTPELDHTGGGRHQPGALTARAILEGLSDEAEFRTVGRDHFGRDLVEGEVNGQGIDEAMIRAGAGRPMAFFENEDQQEAARQGLLRRINPAARTVRDELIDLERSSVEGQINSEALRGRGIEPEGDLSRALDRGMANLTASLGSAGQFLGEKLGIESIAEAGSRTVARSMVKAALNPSTVESFEDIDDLGEFGTFALEKIGENIPNVASMAIGGVAGAGTRLAIAGIGKGAIKQTINAAGNRAIKRKLAASGARAGAVAATFPIHLGEGAGELRDAGVSGEDTNLPFLTAAINTVLDVAPMEALLRVSFGGLKPSLAKELVKKSNQVLTAKGVMGRIAKGVAVGGATGVAAEAPTELAQELVNMTARAYHDPEFDWDDPEVESRLLNAAAAGGIVGGALGGAGRGASSSFSAINDYLTRTETAEEQSDAEQAGPEQDEEPPVQTPDDIDTARVNTAATAEMTGEPPTGSASVTQTLDDINTARLNTAATAEMTGESPVSEDVAEREAIQAVEAEEEARITEEEEEEDTRTPFQRLDEDTRPPQAKTSNEPGPYAEQREALENPLRPTTDRPVPTQGELDVTIDQGRARLDAGDAVRSVADQLASMGHRGRNELGLRSYSYKKQTQTPAQRAEVEAIIRKIIAGEPLDENDNAVLDVIARDPDLFVANVAGLAGNTIEAAPADPGAPTTTEEEALALNQALDARNRPQSAEPLHPDPITLATERNKTEDAATARINDSSVLEARNGIKRVIDTFRERIAASNPGFEAVAVTPQNQRKTKEEGGEVLTLDVVNPEGNPDAEPGAADARVVARFTVKTLLDNETRQHGVEVESVLPPEDMRGGMDFRSLRALVQAAWSGHVGQRGRFEMIAPDGTKARFNLASLVQAGSVEQRAKNEAVGKRDRLAEALGTLIDLGYRLPPGGVKIKDNARVGFGKNGVTWGDVRRAKNFAVTDFEPMLKEMSNEELQAVVDEATTYMPKANMTKGQKRFVGRANSILKAALREQERRGFPEVPLEDEGRRVASAELEGAPAFDEDNIELGDHALGREEEADTRGFDTDEQQARRSSARPPQAPATEASRENAVVTPNSRLKQMAEFVSTMLTESGARLSDQVTLLSTRDLPAVLARMKEQGSPQRNIELLERALNEVSTARVVFVEVGPGRAAPVIVTGDQFLFAAEDVQMRAMLHETGHIVMRHFLSSASNKAKAQMRKAWGEPGSVEFEENFANAFTGWALRKHRVGGSKGTAHSRIHEAIQSVLTSMTNAIRKMWARARKIPDVTDRYSDFIELLVNRRRRQTDERQYRPKTKFGKQMQEAMKRFDREGNEVDVHDTRLALDGPAELNLTEPARAAVRRRAEQLVNSRAGDASRATLETMKGFYRSWWQSYDAVLRRLDLGWLADHFHHEPGKRKRTRPVRVQDEVGGVLRPYMEQVEALAEKHLPTFKPWHILPWVKKPEQSETAREAAEILIQEGRIEGNSEAAELARGVRQYFDQLYTWLRDQGVYVPYRQNYFPVAMDVSKLWQQGSKQRVIEIFQEWSKTEAAQTWWEEKFEGRKLNEAEVEKFAEHMYAVWTGGPGVMAEFETHMTENDVEAIDFNSPGFAYKNQRKIPRSLMKQLEEFRERDLAYLMTSYARSAVKRGVWQSRFGAPEGSEIAGVMQQITDAFDEAKGVRRNLDEMEGKGFSPKTVAAVSRSNAEAWAKAHRLRDELIEKYQNEYGVNIYDPAAQLKVDLVKQVTEGKLDQQDYDRVANEILPGLMGTLGADFNIGGKPRPGFRRLSQIIMVYQAARILSLAALTQLVDMGTMAARVQPGDWTTAMQGVLGSLAGQGRAERIAAAKMFGLIQRDITEHMLNDEAGILQLSRNISRANEAVFRYNGMHGMTNFMRSVDLIMGKNLIKSWAAEGDTAQLDELSISLEEARAWVADGMPLEWSDRHSSVLGGLNQFIDESVVRPTAAHRPRLGNDARYMLLWHLKGFMYGFQKQIIERAYNQAKTKWGEEEGARRIAAAMPVLLLGAWTLPMAALGMELRWLISPPRNGEPRGWEYTWETINRSGNLGVFQLMTDLYETERHGKPSVLAPLGPTVSHVYDLATKDLFTDDWEPAGVLQRSLPAYPILLKITDAIQDDE